MNKNNKIAEKGWSQMSSLLDAELPTNNRRKPILWLGLAASLLVIGFIGFNQAGEEQNGRPQYVKEIVRLASLPQSLNVTNESFNYLGRPKHKSKSISNTSPLVKSLIEPKKTVESDITKLPSKLEGSLEKKVLNSELQTKNDISIDKVNTLAISVEAMGEKEEHIPLMSNPKRRVNHRWGVTTGVLSNTTKDIERLSLGVFYNIGTKHWATELGLAYDFKLGISTNGNYSRFKSNNTHYLRLPVIVNYQPFEKLYFKTGVETYVSYKNNPKAPNEYSSQLRLNTAMLDSRPTNFGVVAVAGFGTHVNSRIDLGLQYGYEFFQFTPLNNIRHQAAINLKYYIK